MELVLTQRQQQGLSMTFQLRQAIEILQYSTHELEHYIREQELENPLIELTERAEKQNNTDTSARKGADIPEHFVRASSKNKRDELMTYATFMFKDEDTLKLLKYIIYNLDDNGYLQYASDDSAIDATYTELEIMIGVQLLQQIGPVGIGARNLQECLLLQIRNLYPENLIAEKFVRNHLQLLADHKWNEIALQMTISLSEVKDLHEFIRTLNPKPCSFTSDQSIDYWTPDIIVDYSNNALTFQLNDGYLPVIRLNDAYTHFIHTKSEATPYINEQYKNYQWLIRSIKQRKNTLIAIMNVLIERQDDFFKYGLPSLKPLTLKEIADLINMHESTVSRATSNKVIQTPCGTFDLRVLFTSKLVTTEGGSVAQTTVKAWLEKYIAEENKFKPHSDQKIAEYFNTDKGITISRRTIAKYREELRIPSASKRKEIQI